MSGNPIESAPRDGSEFWAYTPEDGGLFQKCKHWDGHWLMIDENLGGGIFRSPTHWWPQPKLPIDWVAPTSWEPARD